MKRTILIGIDTGTNTGFAVYNTTGRILERVDCLMIHDAIIQVIQYQNDPSIEIQRVRVEDARLARFGRQNQRDSFKLQGAGSVKRDASIWEDFLTAYKIPFEMVRPNKRITKWDSSTFKRYFKWPGRTNSHSRDAALLVVQ